MHSAGNICSAWFLDIRIYKLVLVVYWQHIFVVVLKASIVTVARKKFKLLWEWFPW